jgi:hypothetical protein
MLLEKIQLESGEDVLKVVRKHWFIIVTELFSVFIMFSFPFIMLFFFAIFPDALSSLSVGLADYTTLIAFGVASWTVLSLIVGFTIWTHYYLDLWVITDRRIIVVNQIHFFNRNVSSFRLERLQDIEFYVRGLIPTILNFGTIKAQTAGAFESNFKTRGLPDPRGLQAVIQKATDERLAELHNNPDLAS